MQSRMQIAIATAINSPRDGPLAGGAGAIGMRVVPQLVQKRASCGIAVPQAVHGRVAMGGVVNA